MAMAGLLFTMLIIGLIAYALGWRPQFTKQWPYQGRRETPLEILKNRYARGEISQGEYQRMRQDLER
jgi:uncharacterized membrane protein